MGAAGSASFRMRRRCSTGRRRVGQGDSFWQYRPFLSGDGQSRIDWRASGKSDRHFVRETEWEAAQSVFLWRDASASMDWRSGAAVPSG